MMRADDGWAWQRGGCVQDSFDIKPRLDVRSMPGTDKPEIDGATPLSYCSVQGRRKVGLLRRGIVGVPGE